MANITVITLFWFQPCYHLRPSSYILFYLYPVMIKIYVIQSYSIFIFHLDAVVKLKVQFYFSSKFRLRLFLIFCLFLFCSWELKCYFQIYIIIVFHRRCDFYSIWSYIVIVNVFVKCTNKSTNSNHFIWSFVLII